MRREGEKEREMDADALAKAFVEHYYTTFDDNRGGLANLYQEGSMLTFEGQKILGSPNIVAKLTSLPFQQCHHSITTVDSQPSGVNAGMIVFVSGNLQLSGEQHALKFSQVSPPLRFSIFNFLYLGLIAVHIRLLINNSWFLILYTLEYLLYGRIRLVFA